MVSRFIWLRLTVCLRVPLPYLCCDLLDHWSFSLWSLLRGVLLRLLMDCLVSWYPGGMGSPEVLEHCCRAVPVLLSRDCAISVSLSRPSGSFSLSCSRVLGCVQHAISAIAADSMDGLMVMHGSTAVFRLAVVCGMCGCMFALCRLLPSHCAYKTAASSSVDLQSGYPCRLLMWFRLLCHITGG